MFAVIKTGGKQYRVAAKDVLQVDRLEAEPGAVVEFGEVLVVGGDAAGGDATVVGTPMVDGASVAAEVLDHVRGAKVIAFKKRRRKNSRRKRGHRQQFSLVRITEILTEGRRPSPPPSASAEEPVAATADSASADTGAVAGAADPTPTEGGTPAEADAALAMGGAAVPASAPSPEGGGAAIAEGVSADAASPAAPPPAASEGAVDAAATGEAPSAEGAAAATVDESLPEGGAGTPPETSA